MNLSQAYLGWQQQSENRKLYVNTRDAFRKAWFTLPTNKPCSYYTKEVLGMALAETREVESAKTKAASVMCQVLSFFLAQATAVARRGATEARTASTPPPTVGSWASTAVALARRATTAGSTVFRSVRSRILPIKPNKAEHAINR